MLTGQVKWAIFIKRYFRNRLSALRSVCAQESQVLDGVLLGELRRCQIVSQTRAALDSNEEDGAFRWQNERSRGFKINGTNFNTLPGLLAKYLNSYQTGSFTPANLTSFATFTQPSFRVKYNSGFTFNIAKTKMTTTVHSRSNLAIKSKSRWSVYAAGETVAVLHWKQTEMTWCIATRASVCRKPRTVFPDSLIGRQQTTDALHDRFIYNSNWMILFGEVMVWIYLHLKCLICAFIFQTCREGFDTHRSALERIVRKYSLTDSPLNRL